MAKEHTGTSKVSLGVTALIVVAAFVLIIVGSGLCSFVEVTGTDENGSTRTVLRGIWKGESGIGTTCMTYSGIYKDAYWKAAQAFSAIAMFTGLIAIAPLLRCKPGVQLRRVHCMSSFSDWASLFSGLTLLMLNSSACVVDGLSNSTCKMSKGANCVIAAVVLFFFSSIFMYFTYKTALKKEVHDVEKADDEAAAEADTKEQPAEQAVDPEIGEGSDKQEPTNPEGGDSIKAEAETVDAK